jgi:tetratricopeptide (TPR) repeat protein
MKPIKSRLVAISLSLALGGVAWADSIKLGGFWIDEVTIQGISGDTIVYTNNQDAEVVKPVAQLEGLKITAYPDVAIAQDALDKKNDDAAAKALTQVMTKSRLPWLKQWAAFHRVQALDRMNKGVEAAQGYIDLVRMQPVAHFLTAPPVKSVQAATAAQKVDIRKRLEPLLTRADSLEGLKALVDLVKDAVDPAAAAAPPTAPAAAAVVPVPPTVPVAPVPPTSPATPPAPAPAAGTSEPVAAAPSAPAAAPSTAAPTEPVANTAGLALPVALDDKDPVTALLKSGKFTEALAECDRLLAMKELRLGMRLYQKGMAQLQLAEAAGNDKLYRDAALSFMRVAIYFPKSEYAGAAMMEAGYAHQKFGRPDIAANLWQKAQLMIDSETDPALSTRLAALVAGSANP